MENPGAAGEHLSDAPFTELASLEIKMADQSDVEATLAGLVTAILYPQGSQASSVIGSVCRIFRGWPNSAALDADLAASVINISITSDAAKFRNTTRYIDPPSPRAFVQPTLIITAAGQTATISGTAAPGQLAGLLVDNAAYVHRTVAADTPVLVAAILANYIRTRRVVLVSGATITIPGAGSIIGRITADQNVLTETRRQAQGFRVACWCPTPASRDSIVSLLDAALSQQAFIALPDTAQGRLRLSGTITFDQSQNANLFRRDLLFTVEYATTVTQTLPSLIAVDARIAPNGGPATQSLLG